VTDVSNIKRLQDRADIQSVLFQYGDCVDRRDFEGVLDCFHSDATFEMSGASLPVGEFFKHAQVSASAFRETAHHISNVWFQTQSDSDARTQCYILGHHWLVATCPDNPPLFPNIGRDYAVLVGGRYEDEFVCRDGKWKIRHRKLFFEWDARVDLPALVGTRATLVGKIEQSF
jgi:hypothetical protein